MTGTPAHDRHDTYSRPAAQTRTTSLHTAPLRRTVLCVLSVLYDLSVLSCCPPYGGRRAFVAVAVAVPSTSDCGGLPPRRRPGAAPSMPWPCLPFRSEPDGVRRRWPRGSTWPEAGASIAAGLCPRCRAPRRSASAERRRPRRSLRSAAEASMAGWGSAPPPRRRSAAFVPARSPRSPRVWVLPLTPPCSAPPPGRPGPTRSALPIVTPRRPPDAGAEESVCCRSRRRGRQHPPAAATRGSAPGPHPASTARRPHKHRRPHTARLWTKRKRVNGITASATTPPETR
jgi:hypothetical protein